MEEINESHVSHWTEMITKSDPQVLTSPYTAYMDIYGLKKHIITFPAQKLKDVVGYQLRKPKVTLELIQEIVDKARAEGNWPNCPPRD